MKYYASPSEPWPINHVFRLIDNVAFCERKVFGYAAAKRLCEIFNIQIAEVPGDMKYAVDPFAWNATKNLSGNNPVEIADDDELWKHEAAKIPVLDAGNHGKKKGNRNGNV